ncbi:hypothetical protein [Hydrocarboniphaga sp.]|uniref:hypothetical protein n=1 Tax=Hydrocarboniphaga sp. TaxID=2033016 RepID=UPI003D0F6C1D
MDGLGRDAMRRMLGGVLLVALAVWLIAASSQARRDDGSAGLPEVALAEPSGGDVDAEPASVDLDKDVDTATRDFGATPLTAPGLPRDTPQPRGRGPKPLLRPPTLV